jgi:hypothetical protein
MVPMLGHTVQNSLSPNRWLLYMPVALVVSHWLSDTIMVVVARRVMTLHHGTMIQGLGDPAYFLFC